MSLLPITFIQPFAALMAKKGTGESFKAGGSSEQTNYKSKPTLARTTTGMSATSGKSLKAESVVEEQEEYQVKPKANPFAGLFSPKGKQ